MHTDSLLTWQHEHTFGQDQIKSGERSTLIVILITAAMMVVEVVTGMLFGSMALLADGLHMASHAAALSISAVAYVYARRRAGDRSFNFGTGKVNALAGFTSAVLLAMFALLMAWESVGRFFNPVEIIFDQAILVAVIGLAVNFACAAILGNRGNHHHESDHHHDHSHDSDHNLRAAYLHVIADALTSLLAIFALLSGKYLGLNWMDPLMGVVGAVMVARWSWGLLRDTSGVLLDRHSSTERADKITQALESAADNRIADLHVWSIGPAIYAATITVVTGDPQPPDHYKTLLPEGIGLAHVTIEVHPCQ